MRYKRKSKKIIFAIVGLAVIAAIALTVFLWKPWESFGSEAQPGQRGNTVGNT
ncbi:MAG: hypothetical protein LBN43_01900 [Oscillospiraceae bacterium]|jgi:hypothetical protein|nr:hypothetical protein [Oscillospiraceae bacterium]